MNIIRRIAASLKKAGTRLLEGKPAEQEVSDIEAQEIFDPLHIDSEERPNQEISDRNVSLENAEEEEEEDCSGSLVSSQDETFFTEEVARSEIDGSSSHSGEYLVCKGALCKCDSSVSPTLVELIVQNDKFLLNEDKPAATISDNTFKATFGNCSKLPKDPPCPYVPSSEWEVRGEEDILEFGGKIGLPETALLRCSFGGIIRVDVHGQEVSVANEDEEEVLEDAIVEAIAPLTPKVAKQEEKLEDKNLLIKNVDKIKLLANEFIPVAIDSKSNPTKISQIKEIHVLTNEVLEFVTTPNNSYKNKTYSQWIIHRRKEKFTEDAILRAQLEEEDTLIYNDLEAVQGLNLKLTILDEAYYYIEGFGGKIDSPIKIHSSCCILIKAHHKNTLQSLSYETNGITKKILVRSGENLNNLAHFNKACLYNFKLDHLMPLNEEARNTIRIEIFESQEASRDSGGTALSSPMVFSGTEFSFEPQNSNKVYVFNVYQGSEILAIFNFECVSTDKLEVIPIQEIPGSIVRRTQEVEFRVANIEDPVRWERNGSRIPGTSRTNKLPTLREQGEYSIKAKLPTLFSDISGTYKVTVLPNYVNKIQANTNNTVIGKGVDFIYTTVFPTDEKEKVVLSIKRQDENGENVDITHVSNKSEMYSLVENSGEQAITFWKKGIYTVDYRLDSFINGRWKYFKAKDLPGNRRPAASVKIEVTQLKIEEWCFLNKDGQQIVGDTNETAGSIGWGHTFDIRVKIKGLDSLDHRLRLNLWHKNKKGGFIPILYSEQIRTPHLFKDGLLEIAEIGDADFWQNAKDICKQNKDEQLNLCFSLSGNEALGNHQTAYLTFKDIYTNAEDFFSFFQGRKAAGNEQLCFNEKKVLIKTPEKTTYNGAFLDEEDAPFFRVVSYKDKVKIRIQAYPALNEDMSSLKYRLHVYENIASPYFFSRDKLQKEETDAVKFDRNNDFTFDYELNLDTFSGNKPINPTDPRFFFFRLEVDPGYFRSWKEVLLYPSNYGINSDNDQHRISFEEEIPADEAGKLREKTDKLYQQLLEANAKLSNEIREIELERGFQLASPSNNPLLFNNTSALINSDEVDDFAILGPQNGEASDLQILQSESRRILSEYRELSKRLKEIPQMYASSEKNDASMPNNELSYFYQLKVAESPELQNSVAQRVAAKIGFALETSDLGRHNHELCPNCKAPVTVELLKKLFSGVSEATLNTVAEAYTKYMTDLKMDTCWNKAHFFAQVAVETGYVLNVSDGEDMSYSRERLLDNFPSRFFKGKRVGGKWVSDTDNTIPGADKRVFKSEAHREKADALVSITNNKEKQKAIANYVYDDANGISLGNTQEGDPWRFRGSGLIQLTGRANFENVAKVIERLWDKDILSDEGAEEVRTNLELAVLTSMGYYVNAGINKIANGIDDEKTIKKDICEAVGNNVKTEDQKGKKMMNHDAKHLFYRESTSIVFNTKECDWSKDIHSTSETDINRYRVDVDAFTYEKTLTNDESNIYLYEVFENSKLNISFVLKKNKHGFLAFPEGGVNYNWGRYGDRDNKNGYTKSDNWINEEACAALLGFFYSLPLSNINEKLYYNDISAYNGIRNLGHSTHKTGDDIDIRYPGSRSTSGEVLWTEAMLTYDSEEDFIKVLNSIMVVAKRWRFTKNYAYKIGIKETMGTSLNDHQNHFHLGHR